jgi:hypothetical protein
MRLINFALLPYALNRHLFDARNMPTESPLVSRSRIRSFRSAVTLTHVLEGVLILLALTGLYFFLRAGLAHEPVRG